MVAKNEPSDSSTPRSRKWHGCSDFSVPPTQSLFWSVVKFTWKKGNNPARLGLVWMSPHSPQSTCVEVDWGGI
jgi:hypothetical protein